MISYPSRSIEGRKNRTNNSRYDITEIVVGSWWLRSSPQSRGVSPRASPICASRYSLARAAGRVQSAPSRERDNLRRDRHPTRTRKQTVLRVTSPVYLCPVTIFTDKRRATNLSGKYICWNGRPGLASRHEAVSRLKREGWTVVVRCSERKPF